MQHPSESRGAAILYNYRSEYIRVWSDLGVKKYQLTLILNTDGVSPHASSKAKFWPLMFTIMEIPPRLRSSFTIVWGIWFDKKFKPIMYLFLKPFVSSLVKINSEGGVSWKNPTTSLTHTSLVRAPLIVADAPARPGILNMQEHQSKYACNACEQKTSKLPPPPTLPGERRNIRKRRFTFKKIAATLRTNHRMLACGTLGTDLNPKRGLKGLTVIQDIPFLDLSTCVLAEYMHCALGVVKQICSLWLFERGPWNIADHLQEINRFLEQEIHPPDLVSRLPRSLEYFSQLKCNEFRSFLLYFSLVVCAPYLKEEYHQHWILFVHATFLLSSDSISGNDLITAETLIRLFVRDIGPLYGDKNYVYNVHQLLHLALYVRRWGPLWSNSAFGFEDVNGTLAAMIHGSKHEGRELLNQLTLAQGNQMLKNMIVSDTIRSKSISVLGKLLRCLTELESLRLQELNVVQEGFTCYSRVQVGREVFSSEEYDKNFKRRNSYVEVRYGNQKVYGRIRIFCKCNDSVFCFLSVYKVVHSKFFFHTASLTRVGHIIPFEVSSGEFIVCKVVDIMQKLIQVGDYLCLPPNSIERNL